jgi:hypothetical protein
MTPRLLALSALLAGLATAPAPAQAEVPEHGTRWFIDVNHGLLRPITLPGQVGTGSSRTFWYVVLKLTNKTGQAHKLDLTARSLIANVKQQPVAAAGLYADVTEAIGKKEKIEGLVNLLALSGELADNESKDAVVVFPDLSPLANHIDVRIGGLTNTLFQEGRTVWLEETELSIKFHRVGDEFNATSNKVLDKGRTWVTLKREKVRG